MRTTYRSPHVVVVDSADTSSTYLDAEKPISTRLFSAKIAWGLLNPVDCSYTLVFECEKGTRDQFIHVLSDDPYTDEEKAKFLALFATYDKVTIKDLRAVETKPEGPYCVYEEEEDVLSVRVGTNKWRWRLGVTIYTRNLSTADIAALCNPHKCEARVNAFTKDNALVSYFNLGTLTPEEMLKYDCFSLISVSNKEH